MLIEIGLVGFAVGAAIATFFSPCIYGLLPAYLGYVAHDLGPTPRVATAVLRGSASAIGAMAAFMLLGAGALLAGAHLNSVLPMFEVAIGILLVSAGIALLSGRYPRRSVPLYRPDGSYTGFAAFGAGYAIAGTGCVAPVVFAVAVTAASAPMVTGVAVIGAYTGTFAVLLIAATLIGAMGADLATDRLTLVGRQLTRIAGALLIAGGLVQVAIGLGMRLPAL